MELVKVDELDLLKIEGGRTRIFQAVSEPLTAQTILSDIQQHHRQRVIVICNTVSQSQGLFQDLKALDFEDKLEITLLHSRFLPEDRATKESYLKEAFAQNWQADGTCKILIATQVIEAGLNITCEVMHAHLCPMNSLLQRGGRCARFSGEQGTVYVYRSFQVSQPFSELAAADLDEEELEATPKKKQKFLPYNDELCELTWQVLVAHTQSEVAHQSVGFRTEEQWINQVHGEEDSLQAKRRENDRADFNRKFNSAIFQGDRSTASDLIRLVDNRSVFVWQEVSLIDLNSEQIDPKKLLPFSVPITTLCKVWREVQNLEYQIDWIFKRIKYPAKRSAETYDLPICIPVRTRTDLVSSLQILVNPRYVHYDDEVGLVFGENVIGNHFTSPDKVKKQMASEYQYCMDNYVGHLVLMWKCWREPFLTVALKNGRLEPVKYASVRDELLPAGGRFIQAKIFPEATASETEFLFEYLVFLAIFTHDLGKLQVKWQQVMRGWQAIAHSTFNGKNPGSHLLAHTDYNPEDEQQKNALKAYEKQHKRPNHAIESAYLSREILSQTLVPLLRDRFTGDSEPIKYSCHAVLMAAGRHHTAWAKGWETDDVSKLKQLHLHPEAQRAIAASWRSMARFFPQTELLPPTPPTLSKTSYAMNPFDLNRFEVDQLDYLQLYWLVVRALRLCDQRAVSH
ncbi:MAG: CRISPR-associated helicase Cas3' [Actinomycetota bacterium]